MQKSLVLFILREDNDKVIGEANWCSIRMPLCFCCGKFCGRSGSNACTILKCDTSTQGEERKREREGERTKYNIRHPVPKSGSNGCKILSLKLFRESGKSKHFVEGETVDIETAFLCGILDGEIHIELAKGLEHIEDDVDRETMCTRLTTTFCGGVKAALQLKWQFKWKW